MTNSIERFDGEAEHVRHGLVVGFGLEKAISDAGVETTVSIVLQTVPRFDGRRVVYTFFRCVDVKLDDAINTDVTSLLKIYNIRAYQLDGLRYAVFDGEEQVFSLKCLSYSIEERR